MGNTNEKNNMSSIILSDKVESLNKLTNSILFYKKTGYKLSFKPQEKNVFDDIFEKLPFVDVNVVCIIKYNSIIIMYSTHFLIKKNI